MLSGFWGWFLVVVFVVLVFSADRLPEWKKSLEVIAKDGVDAVKKGTKTAQEKISNKVNEKRGNSDNNKSE